MHCTLYQISLLRALYAVMADDASALMSLARHKDSELLQAFEGCFEGDEYKGEIDDDLFLAQVSVVILVRIVLLRSHSAPFPMYLNCAFVEL